ncbi:MAG TPA: serine hydroxymethyltransferase, partial [Planctomycetaceae bacterium]|nr:serine hydroxymethyltransferase [Planctomycetaceae bacterium]
MLDNVASRFSALQQQDAEIFQSLEQEMGRQKEGLELIASENYTSAAIQEIVGSVLTNKYAEG